MLRMLEGEVMNTTESGTEYELMVKSVYNRLYATEGVENQTIQHNVKFIGKSGATHQIDLYWEFTVNRRGQAPEIFHKESLKVL